MPSTEQPAEQPVNQTVAEPTHGAILASISEFKKEALAGQAALSQRLDQLAAAQVARDKKVDDRFAEGAKRMQEQDRSLVFQGRILRSVTVSQLKEVCQTLMANLDMMEVQEKETLERLGEMTGDVREAGAPETPRKYPPDAPTRRANPLPTPPQGTKLEDS